MHSWNQIFLMSILKHIEIFSQTCQNWNYTMGKSSDEEFEDTEEIKDDKGKKTPGLQVKSSIKDEEELSFPDLEERAPLSEGEIKKIFETIGGLHRKYQVTFKDESLSDLEKTKRLKKIQDHIAR